MKTPSDKVTDSINSLAFTMALGLFAINVVLIGILIKLP